MKFLFLTCRHKWWVFYYGLKVGCPIWRLITHDLSKLSWKEYPHYQRQFYGDKGDQLGFQLAWLHHQHVNDHHYEHWIPITRHDRGTPRGENLEPLPMSDDAILESISDWFGASRGYDRKPIDINNWPWLDKRLLTLTTRLHPETYIKFIAILKRLGRKF